MQSLFCIIKMKFFNNFYSKIMTGGGAYNSKIKRCIKLNNLLAFVNVANYSEAELYEVQVQLNRDIDISNLDIYTKYGFESFPNLQKFSGYFEYNGFQILKDGKYFNIYTGTLSDEPQGEYTDIM